MRLLIVVLVAVMFFPLTEGRRVEMEIQQKHEQMLYPSVSIGRDDGGHGSGVVIAAQQGIILILTAAHVVKRAGLLTVVLFPEETEHTATVIKISQKHDLALLAVEGEHPYVATLSEGPTPLVYQEVWKVGAGGSQDPHPGAGHITLYEGDLMMIDSGIVFGDSGGPVFIETEEGYELIGIIVVVAALSTGVPVFHQGMAHNLETLWDFLSHP